jgi:hypothetical protein
MHPSRQQRQWRAQLQSRPGSSTDHREPQRRLHGTYVRHDNQYHDAWPPISTSPLQPQRHADSAATPAWRDRVQLPESQAQGGAGWVPSEVEEHSQRRQPPVRRWQSPEPTSRLRRSGLESNSVSRGHAPDPFVHEPRDSEVARDARSNQRQYVPNACHDDGDDGDDDDDKEEEEEEDSAEQSNSTFEHRYSPPARSYERRQSLRADHRFQRAEGPNLLSQVDHVSVLHNQVQPCPAHIQPSRRVEMPARRCSQSEMSSQDWQSETSQERATQSLTTSLVNVQSYPILPTTQDMVDTGKSGSSMVRRLHTFEASQVPSLEDKHDDRFDNGECIGSESNVHSTSKRKPSARGKRKATLKHDVGVVHCSSEAGEEFVAIEANTSACERGNAKPRRHEIRKRHRKQCRYPEGCSKGAQGRTMFCKAHGGGKRCQYPEGCDKSARGQTMFCKAHGGGKRCQYPEGCDSSARGSTMFCVAHGGGKRCQYPQGCDKSGLGSTMFCKAHGGGKRCQYPQGCDKGAADSTMFCKAHGGGKRCQYPEGCDKSARGSTMLCKAHGGGRRCGHETGCRKHVARGGLCKSHAPKQEFERTWMRSKE